MDLGLDPRPCGSYGSGSGSHFFGSNGSGPDLDLSKKTWIWIWTKQDPVQIRPIAIPTFVLPSRGEGWGRPVVEAMAMALPVIATNWSGPTEYLTEQNGYPLPFDGMSEVRNEPFEGHLWAEPSVDRLRFLMRLVVSNRSQAMAKGLQARVDMKGRFSPQIVADQVVSHLQEILHNLD